MTKDGMIEKVYRLITDYHMRSCQRPYEYLATEIVNAITEEEPQEQFFDNEIVHRGYDTESVFRLFHRLGSGCGAEKLPTKVLAATIGARIEGAEWASVTLHGVMAWWNAEPNRDGNEWCGAGLLIFMKTTIRPEKSEKWKL